MPYRALQRLHAGLKSTDSCTQDLKEEVLCASRTARLQMLGATACCITVDFQLVLKSVYDLIIEPLLRYRHGPAAIHNLEWAHMLMVAIPSFIGSLTPTFSAVTLSGALSIKIDSVFGNQIDDTHEFDSEEKRLTRRESSRKTWKSDETDGKGLDETPGWREKVHELAGRGLALEKLLIFYSRLGTEYMPHFNSSIHTTEDVVRQAVIPFSAAVDAPTAGASILMERAYTRPNKMVTHNWRNLFRDLVAAVVADALKECDYGMIAYLLDHNFAQIVTWVSMKNMLQQTYWICAFSVDQHVGICGANPGQAKDPVTNEEHPVCSCGIPKAFNSTPPIRADGASIPCEMNKFADMMAYLSSTDDDFEQVIAVDGDFTLFSRAWCVAELAEAHRMGMKQNLKVRSRSTLSLHEDALRSLRVEEMRASRQEDVEEILKTINDKEKFNESLQDLIFDEKDGLLSAWKGMDAAEQMTRVGRLARYDGASKGRLSIWAV